MLKSKKDLYATLMKKSGKFEGADPTPKADRAVETKPVHGLEGSRPSAKKKPKSAKHGKKAAAMTQQLGSQQSASKPSIGTTTWEYRMVGAADSCIERYVELVKIDVKTLKKVATPCMDDHIIPPEDFTTKGRLSKEASKIVLKALYLSRLARPELYGR